MKRKVKHKSKLYQYLEQTNALSGNDAEIKAAIQKYRKQYKVEWRRRKRQEYQEITITLNVHELHSIEAAAKRHHRPRAKFMKEASLAYCSKTFVIPDVLMVADIRQWLIMTYSQIQRRFDDSTLPYGIGKEILQKVQILESEVMKCLRQSQCLDELIQDELKKNPAYAEVLNKLLQNAQK